MKKLWLLLLMVLPLQLVHSQEVHHAPTIEQCRADQKLWFSKLEEPNSFGIAGISYQELRGWTFEMSDCINVDPAFQYQYGNTMSESNAAMAMRFEGFLHRHNVWVQFLAEDVQGKC